MEIKRFDFDRDLKELEDYLRNQYLEEKNMIDELIEKSKEITHNKSGSNSVCFCIGDYALLYGPINSNEIDKKIEAVNSYRARGFNIAPILEYKYDENADLSALSDGSSLKYGWILQSRAKGKELENYVANSRFFIINSLDKFNEQYLDIKEAKQKYIEILTTQTDIDEKHLRKFITDYKTILEEGILRIDPSKATNFFYDKQNGFTFIDIDINEPPYEKSKSYDYLPEYILGTLFPMLPELHINEENVKGSACAFLTSPLTEEEFEIIHSKQQKMGDIVSKIFLDLGWDEDKVKEVMNKRIISRDREDVYSDEQTLYRSLSDRFSKIVSNNRAEGKIPNKNDNNNNDKNWLTINI